MSPAHAPNTCSCPLSRLLSICKETKSVNQKPQAASDCLCPRNQYHISQLVLHSWTCTNHFTLSTAGFACAHQTHVGKKPLRNNSIIKKVLKYSYENICLFFFFFLAALFIFIFNKAKSFCRNHSITGKGQRRAGACCPPKCCFPSFSAPFSFDLAARQFFQHSSKMKTSQFKAGKFWAPMS